jgi:hypothetical protein
MYCRRAGPEQRQFHATSHILTELFDFETQFNPTITTNPPSVSANAVLLPSIGAPLMYVYDAGYDVCETVDEMPALSVELALVPVGADPFSAGSASSTSFPVPPLPVLDPGFEPEDDDDPLLEPDDDEEDDDDELDELPPPARPSIETNPVFACRMDSADTDRSRKAKVVMNVKSFMFVRRSVSHATE